ncbi:MAG: ATP-binding protein [Acidimicrobiales bacterium]
MLFAAPLGLGAFRLYRNEAILRLEREASKAGVEVPSAFATSGDPVELPPTTPATDVGLYDPRGSKVLGDGPARADAAVQAALVGQVTDDERVGQLIVAVPLTSDETVFAVVRAASPADAVRDRAERTWLAMASLAAAAVVLATFAGLALARRLGRPVAQLATAARSLGDGDFTARAATAGIPELDTAADALNATASRLGNLLARERAFSADASHQLRTPLTGLRLRLESTLTLPGADRDQAIRASLGDIDSLETTVESLLALARDDSPARQRIDVAQLLTDLESRWHGALAGSGRPLRLFADEVPSDLHASAAAVNQILDALIDNAFRHGLGTITVRCRATLGNAVAIEVSDEGLGPQLPDGQLFQRRSADATGTGIGLALARALAEAEGGRLQLTTSGPGPTFAVVLPTTPQE